MTAFARANADAPIPPLLSVGVMKQFVKDKVLQESGETAHRFVEALKFAFGHRHHFADKDHIAPNVRAQTNC